VIWKPGQHVSEPGLRIDVVHLAGFHEGKDGGGAMAAPASEPAKVQFFLPIATPRKARSAALFDRQTRPSSRKRVNTAQRLRR
jgi:hypothetical protein